MFIALKPCKFAGQSFLTGEVVPTELVDVKAVRRLKRQHILAEADGETQKATVQAPEGKQLFAVPVLTKDGTLSVELTAEDLEILFTVLQKNANDAGNIVAEQTNKDLLLCIHALDGRKTVQSAAKEKATALSEKNEVTDSPETAENEVAE